MAIWPKFSVASRLLVYIDGPNTILTKNLFLAVLDAQKVTDNGRFWPFLAVFGRFWPFLAMHDGLDGSGRYMWHIVMGVGSMTPKSIFRPPCSSKSNGFWLFFCCFGCFWPLLAVFVHVWWFGWLKGVCVAYWDRSGGYMTPKSIFRPF